MRIAVIKDSEALAQGIAHRLRDREPVLLLELMDHRRVRLLPRTG